MRTKPMYDQSLRAIGQSLETAHIDTFALAIKGPHYVVRGVAQKAERFTSLLKKWFRQPRAPKNLQVLRFTHQDIERLEREGKAKRSRPNRLPDFYSVSNVLRTVGSYLDLQEAQLLEVEKRPLTLMILYQTRDGHPNVEERAIASFYGFFLELHQKRQQKTS